MPAPLPDTTKEISQQDPTILLACCLFGEARGSTLPKIAMEAVARVVINRATSPKKADFGIDPSAPFETNLKAAILHPYAFSSFNPKDPNYSKLLRPTECEPVSVWERCYDCAAQAVASKDGRDTLTMNSDHYFDDSIHPPSWASPSKRTVKIGSFWFYRLYLPAKS